MTDAQASKVDGCSLPRVHVSKPGRRRRRLIVVSRTTRLLVGFPADRYRSKMQQSATELLSSTPDRLASIMTATVKDFDGLIKGLGIKQLE